MILLLELLALARLAACSPVPCVASCSLNGACIAGECRCNLGWRGADCGGLDLVDGAARLLWPPPERRASSWGGTVVRDGRVHRLYVSEMANGCGLSTWRTNSQIVAATSRTGSLGPYKAPTVLVPPFAHNARFVPSTPRSPHILLHIGGYDQAPKKGCGGGVTTARRLRSSDDDRPPLGARILVAERMSGPWNATRFTCEKAHANCDFANPSLAVDPDGGALAAYKVIHGPRRGGAINFARAPTWKGPFSPVGGAGRR